METYPALKKALQMVQSEGVVSWYTDNDSKDHTFTVVDNLVKSCNPNDRIPLVVYGIPGKDCKDGYSNRGFNKNMQDYKAFIQYLSDKVGTRKAVYLLEPDAIGLTANNGCGVKSMYLDYLRVAIDELSKNPNADIFLDVGYWTIEWNGADVAKVINQVWPEKSSKVKGIVLNTSNYQKTEKMAQLCSKFSQESGRSIKCVVDTSRNYIGPPKSNEWCNTKSTGIGKPPSSTTGIDNVPYFLWIKPPGESDGECNGQSSGDQMIGPSAGVFFKDHFVQLWNNGYFVKEKGEAPLN